QFVGLPFDSVNDGVLRSVARSVERMIARLLVRRVVMAGTPQAVTDPSMMPSIIEELIAYNPTAGAVFGIELMRIGHLSIVADDGAQPWPRSPEVVAQMRANGDTTQRQAQRPHPNPPARPDIPLLETVRVHGAAPMPKRPAGPPTQASGEIVLRNLDTP